MQNPSKNPNGIIPNNEFYNFKIGTGQGDYFKLFQDPTVLGFKLFFINIADVGTDSDVIDNTRVINSTGLFGNENNPNSALYYLKSIGDTARFQMLKDFKSLMSKINMEYPWYFQSIEGLNEAWNRDYLKSKFEKEITIQCLESIDLRITALMDLYRNVAFDWQHRRVVLPDNLRKFDLSIKVYDSRNIQKDPAQYLSEGSTITRDKFNFNTQFLGDSFVDTTQITFNFSHCEFMSDNSGIMFSTISNSTNEPAAQSIKIKYNYVEEDSIYRSLIALGNNSQFYYVRNYMRKELDFIKGDVFNEFSTFDNIQSDLGPNNPNFSNRKPDNKYHEKLKSKRDSLKAQLESKKDSLTSFNAKAQLESLAGNIASNVSASAANLVKSRLNKLYLGNVYGFSPSTDLGTAKSKIVNKPGEILGNLFD
jgi:hypothetical protein